MSVGTNLRLVRKARGLTQKQLWDKTGGFGGGIDESSISDIETGKHMNPTIQTLDRLADALGVKAYWFLMPEIELRIKLLELSQKEESGGTTGAQKARRP